MTLSSSDHITRAAATFADGGFRYFAQRPPRLSLARFHVRLYKAMRRKGHEWKLKKVKGKTIMFAQYQGKIT